MDNASAAIGDVGYARLMEGEGCQFIGQLRGHVSEQRTVRGDRDGQAIGLAGPGGAGFVDCRVQRGDRAGDYDLARTSAKQPSNK